MTESMPTPETVEPGISSRTKDRLIDALHEKISRLHLQIITLTAPSADAGYRVTDSKGETWNYPHALAAEIDEDERLVIVGNDTRAIAVFNRHDWAHFERQSAS